MNRWQHAQRNLFPGDDMPNGTVIADKMRPPRLRFPEHRKRTSASGNKAVSTKLLARQIAFNNGPKQGRTMPGSRNPHKQA